LMAICGHCSLQVRESDHSEGVRERLTM
jgi:hypothetical protein